MFLWSFVVVCASKSKTNCLALRLLSLLSVIGIMVFGGQTLIAAAVASCLHAALKRAGENKLRLATRQADKLELLLSGLWFFSSICLSMWILPQWRELQVYKKCMGKTEAYANLMKRWEILWCYFLFKSSPLFVMPCVILQATLSLFGDS